MNFFLVQNFKLTMHGDGNIQIGEIKQTLQQKTKLALTAVMEMTVV